MSSEAKELSLQISQIRRDGGTQLREKIDPDLVDEYAEQMQCTVFPRAIVMFDGHDYWLADGFHRLEARLKMQQETLACLVYEGSRRDAILVAARANAQHGLRRTNADKRRAVLAILADEEWSQKSNRWVAEVCGVGRDLVEVVRRQLSESANRPIEGDAAVRLGQDGKLRPAHRTAPCPAADGPSDPIEAALRCGEAFDACLKHLQHVAAEGERLAAGPGGRFLTGIRLDDFQRNVRQAAVAIAATRPSHRCGRCHGAGCELCDQAGWLCPGKQRLY
jgi:hypothetical protein